jgi:hypothetical protein
MIRTKRRKNRFRIEKMWKEAFIRAAKSGSAAGRALRNIVCREISKGNITVRVNELISNYNK